MGRSFVVNEKGFPPLPQMMLATLEALRSIGGSATLHELDEKVVELEGVTEDEQSYMMPDGKQRKLNYYLSWARTYLKRGNALENSSRGVWALTSKGEGIRTQGEVDAIYPQVHSEERESARLKRSAHRKQTRGEGEIQEEFGPEEVTSDTWKIQLLNTMREMGADAFERLSQRLLREAGFTKVEVRGKTGDGGIDGVGVLRVNLVSFQIYFQCKRWKGNVGSKEIRDFRGALQGRADKGLFITSGQRPFHYYGQFH